MVKVSVIIPVYNTEKYLRECLDSVVNQTLQDIEIICINDGSTDNSLGILKEYEKLDNRIRIISQQNQGQSVARNCGIVESRGQFIYFMDSDDYLELTALEESYEISKRNNLDILIFKLINFDDGSAEKYTSEYYEMDFLKPMNNKIFNYQELGSNSLNIAVSPPGKLFKKELISEMKFLDGLIFEDNLFFAEAMINAERVLFYDKHLYNRRIRKDSTTSSNNLKFADSIIIINKIIDLFKKYDLYEDFKYGLAKKKIDSAYFRYSLVDDEFKEEFFCRVKNDFKNYEEEYENSILFPLDKIYKCIFRNFIFSNSHVEFDRNMEFFNKTGKFPNFININDEFEENVNKIIKNKEIFFIFEDFNIEFGGLTGAVLKRANYLADKGYKVNLLNLDPPANFDKICQEFYNKKILSPKVNFINVFQYFSKKNTISDKIKYPFDNSLNNNYFTEKIINNDNSITLNYYLEDSSQKVTSELYVDDVLIYKLDYENNKKEYYTRDGFRYLINVGDKYKLIGRNEKIKKFNGINNFLYYFMDEVCSNSDKPFLVCDSTSHYYNMNGVKTDAYKIGVLHGNPYVYDNQPIDHISPVINHLKHLNDLETIIVLTQDVKNDLINEFKIDKFTVIPNFISDEVLKTDLAQKDLNKICIFSRISPEKQISDAIKAFKLVCEVKSDAVLEIFGRAITDREINEFNELKKLVNDLNLEDKVIFKGYLSDVNPEMQKSLCTLLISKHEGLPLSLLESMANATPVICYDLKYGPHDVITNGQDGIIIEKNNIDELTNAMIRLLDNPQMAIEMGLNAREKIKSKFSTQNVGYLWENLFLNVMLKCDMEDSNNLLNQNHKLILKNKKLKKKNKRLRNINKTMLESNSWRLTKPIRKIFKLIRTLKNKII